MNETTLDFAMDLSSSHTNHTHIDLSFDPNNFTEILDSLTNEFDKTITTLTRTLAVIGVFICIIGIVFIFIYLFQGKFRSRSDRSGPRFEVARHRNWV